MAVSSVTQSTDPATPDQSHASRYAWQVVAMLWWICFFNYADRQAIFSVFPLLAHDFNLNAFQLGMLGSAFAWTYAIACPVMGIIVDRMRYKTAILAGLEIWSFICSATALARTFTTLLLFRAAEGFGESIYFPASMSMLAVYHPGRTRSRAFGTHQTSVYVGTVAGGLVAGWLGERFGWRASFLIFGALGMVLGVVLARLLKEPTRATTTDRTSFSQVRDFFLQLQRKPSALLLVLGFGAMNFVAVVQLVWMPSYLYGRFHLSLAQAGFLATALAQGGAVLGSVTGGVIADKESTRRGGRILVQIIGALTAAPFVYLCGRESVLATTLMLLAMWGFCKGVYDANIFASLFDELPASMRGASTGVMNAFGWLLGGTTAPVMMGYLAMRHGLGYAIQKAAAGYVLAALLLTVAFILSRKSNARTS